MALDLPSTSLTVIDHPLIKCDLTVLRNRETPHGVFRSTVARMSSQLMYEASRTLLLHEQPVQTPLEETTGYALQKPVCVVSILRAGLGMVDGALPLFPDAYQGHLGMYRDEETHQPVPYYVSLPEELHTMHVFLLDPMLATGGSAVEAIQQLRNAGARHITFVCLIAAQHGVDTISNRFSDVPIFTAALDRELNEHAFICPGLGDAGDRTFGT